MRIWRISGHADLSGRGGVLAPGRWNPVNTPIVYCADHPASSILEMLAHVDAEDAPDAFQLLHIDVPDNVEVHEPELKEGWQEDLAFTQRTGAQFIAAEAAPVMAVPSAIVPFARNHLLNPRLLDTAGIRIAGVTRHPVDRRLIGHRS